MTLRDSFTKRNPKTIAIAALAVIGFLAATGSAGASGPTSAPRFARPGIQPAQMVDSSVKSVSVSVGVARGQTIRISFRATNDINYHSWTYDQSGRLLQTTLPTQVPAGGFRYSEIHRRDLNVEGERGTGRVQVMVKLVIELSSGAEPSDVAGSLEIINDETGASCAVSPVPVSFKYATLPANQAGNQSCHSFPVGLVPGQTLRISVVNPNLPEQDSQAVLTRVKVFDAEGNVLRSEEVELPQGRFGSVDFNRDDLSLPGEPGTGRLQVSASIQVVLEDGSVRNISCGLPLSIEVVDNRTGKTGSFFAFPGFLGSTTVGSADF